LNKGKVNTAERKNEEKSFGFYDAEGEMKAFGSQKLLPGRTPGRGAGGSEKWQYIPSFCIDWRIYFGKFLSGMTKTGWTNREKCGIIYSG
jgi:hypothetical protein